MKKIKRTLLGLLSGIAILATQSASSMERDEVSELQESIEGTLRAMSLYTANINNAVGSVIVIGSVGSGKSTTLTYLAGKPLVVQRDPRGSYLVTQDPLPSIDIHHGVNPGTKSVALWHDQLQNIVYWDCPGFEDPRGSVEKIINAFSLHQLFNSSLPFKILLVVSELSLQDARNSSFSKVVNTMTELFKGRGQLDKLKECLSLVVTKQRDTDSEILQFILNQAISENENEYRQNGHLQKNEVRELIQFLASNKETRVSSLPRPDQESINREYDGKHREEILGTIATSKYIQNPAVTMMIDDADKNLIEKLAKKLDGSLVDYMKTEGDKRIIGYCLQLIGGHQGTVGDLRRKLRDLSNDLNSLKKISSEAPMVFADRLNDIFDVEDVRKTIGKINFLRTIKNDASCHPLLWAEGLLKTIERIEKLSANPEWDYNLANGNLCSKGILIGMSEVSAEIERRKGIRGVEIYGLNTLFIDADIIAPNICISLIAPCWKILGARTINLNGIDGVNGGDGLDGISGRRLADHGKPGGLGGNGGHLYGKGISFHNLDLLTVCTNGGKGGSGGNGGRGANGVDGKDGLLDTQTLQDGKNLYYRAQGTNGTSGQDGGRGGQRGYGGLSGTALIEGCPWNHIAHNGANGATNGNPGKVGIGGVHGRHCDRILVTGRSEQVARQEAYRNSYGPFRSFHETAYRTVYDTVLLDNEWQVNPNHLAGRGSAPKGNAPGGFNNAQPPQNNPTPLNGIALCQAYKAYYNQQAVQPLIGCFIKAFPNL